MSTFSSVYATVQLAVVSLLLDRRAQAAFALTVALVAGVLLGPDGVDARRHISPGSPYR